MLSKHELHPPWKINGRVLISGYTQLHILFRSPGAVHKPTKSGNVSYGIRATITTKGEFALETVRLPQQSKKKKSKISSHHLLHQQNEPIVSPDEAYKGYKHTSSNGFVFPTS